MPFTYEANLITREMAKEIVNKGLHEEYIGLFRDQLVNNIFRYTVPVMGIEWELQGSLLTDKCKGNEVEFILEYNTDYAVDVMVDRGICYLYLNLPIDSIMKSHKYIDRIYDDFWNFEISSAPFVLSEYENCIKDINLAIGEIVLGLGKKGLYPFALIMPDTFGGTKVYKHVNFTWWVPLNVIYVMETGKMYSNPPSACFKKAYTLSGIRGLSKGYVPIDDERIHVPVPYIFRNYSELGEYLFKEIILEQIKKYMERYSFQVFMIYANAGLRELFKDMFTLKTRSWVEDFYRQFVDEEESKAIVVAYTKTGENVVVPGVF